MNLYNSFVELQDNDNRSQRKSNTVIDKIYFWTATIYYWLPLLETNFKKQLIVDPLKYLSEKELITVYVFVIMPNLIHLKNDNNHQ